MRKVILACACCCAVLGVARSAAQVPQITPKDAPKRGDTITIEGCIDGQTLTERATRLTYQLEGDKPLIQHLKSEHEGHMDKVTGKLKSERLIGSVKSKTVGKTTFRIGSREQRQIQEPQTEERELDPILEVTAIEHIKSGCHE